MHVHERTNKRTNERMWTHRCTLTQVHKHPPPPTPTHTSLTQPLLKVMEFMENLGIRMSEGYGLTETAPVVSVTDLCPQRRILGTVGRALPGVSINN